MKKVFSLIVASVLLSSSAFAAGGYECKIQDKNLDFNIGGVLSHGIPSGPFQDYGQLQFKDKNLQFLNLIKIDGPAQFWQWGDDLKVIVYHETATGDFATFTMLIETKAPTCAKCDDYTGNYKMDVRAAEKSKTFTGEVRCFVE